MTIPVFTAAPVKLIPASYYEMLAEGTHSNKGTALEC